MNRRLNRARQMAKDPKRLHLMVKTRSVVDVDGRRQEAFLVRTADRDYVWISNGRILACGLDQRHSHQHIAVRRLFRNHRVYSATDLVIRLRDGKSGFDKGK